MYGHSSYFKIQWFINPSHFHFMIEEKHVFPSGMLPVGRKRKMVQQRQGGVSSNLAKLLTGSRGCVLRSGARKGTPCMNAWDEASLAFSRSCLPFITSFI